MKSIRACIALVVIVSLPKYVDAVGTEDWAIYDIYGDAQPLFIQDTDSIDLTFKKESFRGENREREKTLRSDFDEFIRSSLLHYTFTWIERAYIAPSNFKKLFTTPLPKYLYAISGWQGCKGSKARRGLCSPVRKAFLDPPLNDGDPFITNYVEHPLVGMSTYLYFRALGYNRISSSFGSFWQSLLFEYTVEGWQQPPSLNDIIATPGLGVPLGILLEETSSWLAKRNSQFLRFLSYVVNPTKIFIRDEQIAWQNFGAVAFRFSW